MFILSEKVKNKSDIVINLQVKNLDNNINSSNTLKYLKKGKFKHYPSSVKEWYNSIYNFKKDNFVKTLPLKDRIIYKLFYAYFNINKLNHYAYNNLSMGKVFISNPEVKHFNNKLNITIYAYNKWIIYFYRITKVFFFQNNKLSLLVKNKPFLMAIFLLKYSNFDNKLLIFVKRLFIKMIKVNGNKSVNNVYTFFDSIEVFNRTAFNKFGFNRKTEKCLYLYLCIINNFFCYIKLPNIVSILIKVLLFSLKENRVNNFKVILERLEKIYFVKFKISSFNFLVLLIDLYLTVSKILKTIYMLRWYKRNIYFSMYKFNIKNLLIVKNLLNKLYNKKIEINIIKLKYLYLDGNILTLAVANKLKDRKIRVLRVVRMALKLSKRPCINKFFSKLSNFSNLNTVFIKKNFSLSINSSNMPLNVDLIYKPLSYKSRVMFYYLKHKVINGIKLQGSGRLTKRLTASRSISKSMGKGSLKDRVSSYNGLSTVVLRGYVKSNLQYTNINSYNRIGAYGIKGWISSY
jgi:Mitochondrial ribosomal protein (VAR1)